VAHIVLLAEQRRHTGGVAELDLPARNYREAVTALLARFPGLAEQDLARCAVAIDGEIVQRPLLEPLGEHSELVFVPRIGAG
jgi:hypothetical protein